MTLSGIRNNVVAHNATASRSSCLLHHPRISNINMIAKHHESNATGIPSLKYPSHPTCSSATAASDVLEHGRV